MATLTDGKWVKDPGRYTLRKTGPSGPPRPPAPRSDLTGRGAAPTWCNAASVEPGRTTSRIRLASGSARGVRCRRPGRPGWARSGCWPTRTRGRCGGRCSAPPPSNRGHPRPVRIPAGQGRTRRARFPSMPRPATRVGTMFLQIPAGLGPGPARLRLLDAGWGGVPVVRQQCAAAGCDGSGPVRWQQPGHHRRRGAGGVAQGSGRVQGRRSRGKATGNCSTGTCR